MCIGEFVFVARRQILDALAKWLSMRCSSELATDLIGVDMLLRPGSRMPGGSEWALKTGIVLRLGWRHWIEARIAG
jgi:hypothetical protein